MEKEWILGDWRQAVLTQSATIHDAIQVLNEVALKIVMVVDEAGVLLGTVSDGDVRRGLLRGLTMEASIEEIVFTTPLAVPPTMERDLVLQLMVVNKIQQVPVVDENRHVVGLHVWDEISAPKKRNNLMVIMAGGKGKRLRPFTENCPKPLVPVGGKPMIEHIIERARSQGFSEFLIAVHYLGEMIEECLGNGERLGVRIEYLREAQPMGTAGALALLKESPNEAFVVSNGDVLTDVDYGEMIDFHRRHSAVATMAVRLHEWQHPFGVVQMEGVDIVGFEEKPVNRTHINAGVYVLEPDVLQALPENSLCDMPTLFERLQAVKKRTIAYPMHEPWLDVGRPDDLIAANASK